MVRQMDSSEIMDTATRLLQSLASKLFLGSALPMMLCFVGLLFIFQFLIPMLFTTSDSSNMQVQVIEIAVVLGCTVLLALPMLAIGCGYCMALSAKMSSDFILGHEPSLKEAKAVASQSLVKMIGLSGLFTIRVFGVAVVGISVIILASLLKTAGGGALLADVVIVFAWIAAVVGSLIVSPILLGKYSLAPVIMAIERLSAKESLYRSRYLLQSHQQVSSGTNGIVSAYFSFAFLGLLIWGGLMMAYHAYGLAIIVDEIALRSFWGVFVNGICDALPSYLALLLLVPFWTTIMTTVYVDRRVRVEALDIKILANDVLQTRLQRGP